MIGISAITMPAFRETFMLFLPLSGRRRRRLDDHAFVHHIAGIDGYFLVASQPAQNFHLNSVIASRIHTMEMHTPEALRLRIYNRLEDSDLRAIRPHHKSRVRREQRWIGPLRDELHES